ncbi:unnamed protein product [Schistosoma mattheei]|uniref:Uncharacterized protein n=1 Tax=Schistosoma mattheei TaxID=31246 RepID=A0A183NNF3_9TREM|nr:unnamed protein product [Schistosoma mattheei]
MQNPNSILNLVLIGFHHRKGSVVELVYPSLSCDSSDPTHLPYPWRHLPALAIADGAHNYTKDCTYFSLPSIEKKGDSVFGIACYRQADSAVSWCHHLETSTSVAWTCTMNVSPVNFILGIISQRRNTLGKAER